MNITRKLLHKKQGGFTMVELIITLLVAAIFLAGILGMVSTIVTFSVASSQRTAASNLAYANLRLYADGTNPNWFVCPPGETSDVTYTLTSPAPNLPPPVVQTVTANAVYGCGGARAGMPIRVTSTVVYGPLGRSVTHATYAYY